MTGSIALPRSWGGISSLFTHICCWAHTCLPVSTAALKNLLDLRQSPPPGLSQLRDSTEDMGWACSQNILAGDLPCRTLHQPTVSCLVRCLLTAWDYKKRLCELSKNTQKTNVLWTSELLSLPVHWRCSPQQPRTSSVLETVHGLSVLWGKTTWEAWISQIMWSFYSLLWTVPGRVEVRRSPNLQFVHIFKDKN